MSLRYILVAVCTFITSGYYSHKTLLRCLLYWRVSSGARLKRKNLVFSDDLSTVEVGFPSRRTLFFAAYIKEHLGVCYVERLTSWGIVKAIALLVCFPKQPKPSSIILIHGTCQVSSEFVPWSTVQKGVVKFFSIDGV